MTIIEHIVYDDNKPLQLKYISHVLLIFFFVAFLSFYCILFSFNWHHAVFFYERTGHYNVAGLHTCHLLMQTMAETYRKSNFTYSSFTTDSAVNNVTQNLRREVGLDQSSEFHWILLVLFHLTEAYHIIITIPFYCFSIYAIVTKHSFVALFSKSINRSVCMCVYIRALIYLKGITCDRRTHWDISKQKNEQLVKLPVNQQVLLIVLFVVPTKHTYVC